MVLRFIALTAAIAASACIPDMEITEAQVYEVCYTGLPAPMTAQSSTMAAGELRVGAVELEDATLDNPQVGLRELVIRPANGIDDFDFVSDAYVDVESERILDLPSSTHTLYGESSRPPNLVRHALDGDLDMTLVFEGEIPRSNWRVVIDACFSVSGVTITR